MEAANDFTQSMAAQLKTAKKMNNKLNREMQRLRAELHESYRRLRSAEAQLDDQKEMQDRVQNWLEGLNADVAAIGIDRRDDTEWEKGLSIHPCSWHRHVPVALNVGNFTTVVGECNTVNTSSQLDNFLNHLEVTLFRNDRYNWVVLQHRLMSLFLKGRIARRPLTCC